MRWTGEGYLLEEVVNAFGDVLTTDGDIYSSYVMYWSGYIYRYWHYYSSEDSAKSISNPPLKQ